MPANFVWYELMTTDVAAAAAFYGAVVGWKAQDSGRPDMAYTLLIAGDQQVGGIMTAPEAARGPGPVWFGYIGVADVDAAAEALTKAGGVIHRAPADIPGVGRFAMVADPGGAVFVLFQGPPGMTAPPADTMSPGHVGWHELMAADGAAAFDFYSGQFGWTKGFAIDMGPMGAYQTFASGGDPIGGMMTKSADTPRPYWLYYFRVNGLEAAIERIKSAGGRLAGEPHQVPTGDWIIRATDPQNAMFALVSRSA